MCHSAKAACANNSASVAQPWHNQYERVGGAGGLESQGRAKVDQSMQQSNGLRIVVEFSGSPGPAAAA
ncbi:hypothetical protein C0J52_23081 [Blattella germanica]|nr:hypothetical protein C0J52_23081 [Blattella germanica]